MPEHNYSIRRHLEFHYDRGSWAIRGLSHDTGSRFDDLAEAMDYAKAECAAEPACIEMIVGDFHMIAFQEPGWSRRLCYPSPQHSTPAAVRHADRTTNVVDWQKNRPHRIVSKQVTH